MKRQIALLIFTLIVSFSAGAQDIVTLKSGDELKGKIIRLNPSTVVFMPTGINDTITLVRNDVLKLRYQSGTLINLIDEKEITESQVTAYDSMYYEGVTDAAMQYKGYQGASTGVLVSGLAFPFNIIPAIACSATRPSDENLGYTDTSKMKDPSYNAGYKNQAHKIKKKKVWINYAIGSGAMLGFYILMNALIVTAMVY
jgi:hypothetical protein